MTYSSDFRGKVLSVLAKEGLKVSEVATRFNVGVASVFRWINEPEPSRTRKECPTKVNMKALAEDVRQYPSDTLVERSERLGVNPKTIFSAMKRAGYSYKKKRTITPRQTKKHNVFFKIR